jgi:hypothetical protein
MKLLPTLVSLTVLVSTGLSNPQLVVPQVVGFNKVMNARNLYVFSKVGWGASLGTNGMGVSFHVIMSQRSHPVYALCLIIGICLLKV